MASDKSKGTVDSGWRWAAKAGGGQPRLHIPDFVPVCWGAGIQGRIPVPAGFRRNPAAASLMLRLFDRKKIRIDDDDYYIIYATTYKFIIIKW